MDEASVALKLGLANDGALAAVLAACAADGMGIASICIGCATGWIALDAPMEGSLTLGRAGKSRQLQLQRLTRSARSGGREAGRFGG